VGSDDSKHDEVACAQRVDVVVDAGEDTYKRRLLEARSEDGPAAHAAAGGTDILRHRATHAGMAVLQVAMDGVHKVGGEDGLMLLGCTDLLAIDSET